MRIIDADYVIEKFNEINGTAELDKAFEVVENAPTADVLDKIRAEIDVARFIDKDTKLCKNANASGLEVALQIIDKYR